MWRLYFYGELATPETFSLKVLADIVRIVGIPSDIEWFDKAPIAWEEVNKGYIYRQFAGPGEKPPLKLIHG